MNSNKILFFFAALLVISGFYGCVDQEFDEPPVGDLPGLVGNTTIAELKALYPVIQNGDSKLIDQDIIIEAVVVGDDETGNFFRQIAVQDETGGIIIRMNGNGLFGEYPVGRQVFIRAKDLYIGDFNGLPQINGSPTDPIEELLVPTKIVPGERDVEVVPTLVTIEELQNDARLRELLATLIELNDVQFSNADAGASYADPINRFSLNRTLENCDGDEIIVRTSGFADFAGELTPEGKGSIVAVLSVFGDTRQLILNNTDAVDMTEARCGGGGTGGDLISLEEIRNIFNDGGTAVPDNKTIRAVVISDADAGNITGRNMVVQDGTAGITIRFNDNHNFDLGEEVEISVGGLELSEFNGLLQINNVPNGNAVSQGNGTLPTPRSATVSEILANAEAWESTLVQITNASLSGGGTLADVDVISDGTGTLATFVRNTSTFANNSTPTEPVTVTGIVSDFNGPQIIFRNANDIEGGGGSGGDPTDIDAAELRALFDDGVTAVPAGRKIRGIVISDISNGNTTERNLVLQDDTGGIVIRFNDPHSFALGEEVEIVVSNLELSEFNGLLQVNNVPNNNANSFGPGTLPDPEVLTIQQILDNAEDKESTLVRINDVTLSGSSTYNGALTVTDATGSISMFTRTAASFAGNSIPSGEVDLIVIISEFNEPQVLIRNLNDVID